MAAALSQTWINQMTCKAILLPDDWRWTCGCVALLIAARPGAVWLRRDSGLLAATLEKTDTSRLYNGPYRRTGLACID